MFGKIIKIDGNTVLLENDAKKAESNLLGCHVIFEEDARKVVGEITFMDEEFIRVFLVGEIINQNFTSGVIRKPAGSGNIRIISGEELELLIGTNTITKGNLLLGKSVVYPNFNVSISMNEFFANHCAIIGNSGSGKSCGVTRILQNLLGGPNKPVNAHIVMFDAYGEYTNAFDSVNEIPGINIKKYTTNLEALGESELQFPVHLLEADDLAILLSLDDPGQISVLEKTLKLVCIFKDDSPTSLEQKNNIIAKCLLDVLSSGNSPSQVRDQILAILTNYNTPDLNLESTIKQPGYNRSLQQCLRIDDQGKISAITEVMNFLNQFVKVNFENMTYIKTSAYTLDDLYDALEFALISEGGMNSTLVYEKNSIIKARLTNLINGDYKGIFSYNNYVTKEQFIKEFFSMETGEKAQFVNINLSKVDDRFAKVLTKLYSKLFFKFTTELKPRGSYSINIILEEAHRYVQADKDVQVIGYNIFDRITKEGRKYGTLLTFITQRPSELSMTSFSQCSNFLVFRIFDPKDLDMIRNVSTNITDDTIEKLKMIHPGSAYIFGTGIKLPVLIHLDLPNPLPESTSLNISSMWYDGE